MGIGNLSPGAFLNKADEGTIHREPPPDGNSGERMPYLFFSSEANVGQALFSPNRIMPSAGMFGSLPRRAGGNSRIPWQTLLFRPQRITDFGPPHPGSGDSTFVGLAGVQRPPYSQLPDFLLLDNFWMPVVEPYAISQPMATSGKVNMNYRIAPFDYIRRDTAVRAALRGEFIAAVPAARSVDLKRKKMLTSSSSGYRFRKKLDLDETLRQFEDRFDSGDVFRSESEICSLHLVPDQSPTVTLADMPAFYSLLNNGLTGDNFRERPYTRLLPKLTTKSNTYTVHYRVQVLKQGASSGGSGGWDETAGQCPFGTEGLYTIERYIDPNDPALLSPVFDAATIPDIADASMEQLYKYRVVEHKKFAP